MSQELKPIHSGTEKVSVPDSLLIRCIAYYASHKSKKQYKLSQKKKK